MRAQLASRSRNPGAKALNLGGKGQSPILSNAPVPNLFSMKFYSSPAFVRRSPRRIAKRYSAAFQSRIGMVHFLAMCSKAR